VNSNNGSSHANGNADSAVTHTIGTLVGEAPAFLRAVAQLPAAARSDAAVLITGETGTGKETVARAIHQLSDRAPLPFVAVSCGSLTESPLEEELSRLLAQAAKGTVFLDEIEALTERGQMALLRVVQDRTFHAPGSGGEQHVAARFVAATSADLWPRVQAGTFRPDLYYRLCVFTIALPSLRERKDDVLPLALHFMAKHAAGNGAAPTLTSAARSALVAFDWPGNVRELENAMIRAMQVHRSDTIDVDDLGLPDHADVGMSADGLRRSFKVLKRQAVEAFERDYLTRILREHGGNVTHAARSAAKDRRDLGRLLKKYAIDPRLFAQSARREVPHR
jgi:DNA-binding NtrC family response regulator